MSKAAAIGTYEEVKVKLTNDFGKVAEGKVRIQHWSAPARLRRAVYWLSMIWGIGTFTVLFPFIHFFVPPAALFAGPIIAFLLFQQASAVIGGSGQCPSCGAEFQIVRNNYLGAEDKWPIRDTCGNCRDEAVIERV